MEVQVRWMIRRDMPVVLDIERRSFEFAWQEDDFIRCLRQTNSIGMVAEYKDTIVGFMVYELHAKRLRVVNLAVHPDYRRQGVGNALINKLIVKLAPQRRSRILLEVRESNLEAQLFFKSLGFKAVSVLRDFYEDSTEDAYLMQYRVNEESRYELTVTFLHDGGRKPIKIDDPEQGLSLEDIDRIVEFRLRDYLTTREIQAVRDTLIYLSSGSRMSTFDFEDIELELLPFAPTRSLQSQ